VRDLVSMRDMLYGPLPEIKKMKITELKEECQAWRSLWSWTPYGVKEFLVRTGTTVGLVRRDYRRWLGVLLSTEWDLKSMDIGVAEKVYDSETGKYFFEKKIIKVGPGQIIGFEWIEDRKSEDEVLAEQPQEAENTSGSTTEQMT